MRVLCIRNGNYDYVTKRRMDSLLCEGEVYTVIHRQEEEEGLYYGLAEFGIHTGFHSELFIPLSDIDETEIIKGRILQPKKITHADDYAETLSNRGPSDLCVLAEEAREAFTEKENQAITLLKEVQGDSLAAAGIRALIHCGESRTVLDELKQQAKSRAYALECVVGHEIVEFLRSL